MKATQVFISIIAAILTSISGSLIINSDNINKYRKAEQLWNSMNIGIKYENNGLYPTAKEYVLELIFSWQTLLAIVALSIVFCLIFYIINSKRKTTNEDNLETTSEK